MTKLPRNFQELSDIIKRCAENYQKSEEIEVVKWRSIDEFLEDMCKRFPNHDYLYHVLTKITAIDRLYAARLNWQKVNYREVALKLIASDIDHQLENIGKSLTINNVKRVVNAVATVAGFGNPKEPRFWVFASMYLHFHNRYLFPILSSYAEKKLTNIFLKFKLQQETKTDANRYEKFLMEMLTLQFTLSIKGFKFTLSDLDKYLYGNRYLKC